MDKIKDLINKYGLGGKILAIIGILILGIAIVAGGLLLFIYGLNLLGLEVPYTLRTILGSFIILFIIGLGRGKKD